MRIGSSKTRRSRPPFIGRSEEFAYLCAEVSRGAGLITLAGPSGLGKTRLAQQVAGELIDTFDEEGGVWFCNLAGCRSAADLEAEVARTLEIPQRGGDELASSLANRGPLLLILDNADPIAERMGPVIEGWLERCVELQMIVTSIAPVGAQGEVVLALRPLEADDAVALYLDRAQRAWADRTFSSEEAAQIRDLVQRLDCLPLAIELAAARVRLLPPRSMPSWFERRFELLRIAKRGEAPDHPPRRDASLLGAFELTWSHLESHEQIVLARAAVFEGGFTLAAAEAILAADAPALDDLRRKSLLAYEDAVPPRYFLLESVREYALRELQQMGRWEEATRRHAAYYLRHDDAQAQRMSDRRQVESTHWLKEERANLVAIQQRFLSSAPSLAASAGIALGPLIHREGQLASGLTETTLDAARRSQDPKLILAALEMLSILHFRNGRYEHARSSLEEGVELAGRSGDAAAEALALSRLAIVHVEQGRLASSRELIHRATSLSLSLGSGLPNVEGHVRFVAGVEALRNGSLVEAEANLIRSADLFRENESITSAANSLYTLGVALAHQHRYDDARALMYEAIEAIEVCRNHPLEAHFLSNLANLELSTGRLDEAEAIYRRCLPLHRKLGNRFQEGISLGNLGFISLERGELDAAATRLSQAEELFLDCGAKESHAEVLVFSAVLEAKRGRPEEARHLLGEAQAYGSPGGQVVGPLLVEGAEAFLEIASARQLNASSREEAAKMIESARARLASFRREDAPWPSAIPVFRRLLEKELASWEEGIPPAPHTAPPLILRISPEHDWFHLRGGERIVLRNRRVLHRIFSALVQARLDTPGAAVRPQDLIRAGWPGTEISPQSATIRLKVAIWTLRDLGLRTVIRNDPYGYLLDPAIGIEELNEA